MSIDSEANSNTEVDTTGPLVSLEDVTVDFSSESALIEALPKWLKDRMNWHPSSLRAVDDVSLEIGANDVVSIIGESGSGKTTLGKTAVGIQKPSDGTVRYRGQDIWELKRRKQIDDLRYEDVRKALQIVHQDPGASLNPYRTVMAILEDPLQRWYPSMSNADRRERVLELLEACGLTPSQEYEDRYPHELSGGEKQRVALVRAMLVEPDLILADEPVSALDTSLRVEIMDLMLELQEMFETSFVFVSHNLEHARYITNKADGRIAVMYLGEIVEVGPAEEVIRNPKHPYTKVLMWATLPKHPDRAREAIREDSPLRSFDTPEIDAPPEGCRFHTRCPKAREACTAQPPELSVNEDSDSTHAVACYRDLPDHEYWESPTLDEDGENEIPL